MMSKSSRERLRSCEEYQSFASSVGRKRVEAGAVAGAEVWEVFEVGPRTSAEAVVMLGPLCARADGFFRQLLDQAAQRRRALSVESPPFWSVEDFCLGFARFLVAAKVQRAHLVGASLGGFLALKFAESFPDKVASLFVCNGFVDTAIFRREGSSGLFWLLPAGVLRRMVLRGLERGGEDAEAAAAAELMVESLEGLGQEVLAARLSLNCQPGRVLARGLRQTPTTLVDVLDTAALSHRARDLTAASLPFAKRATLKTGGNFPFLARHSEFNLFLNLHLSSAFSSPVSTVQSSDSTRMVYQA